MSHPPTPQSLQLVTLDRPEDSKHLPSYSVSKILNIKQVGKALPVSTVSGCYDVRYLMLGYTLIHIPYWYFKIIILDNGSNKEHQRKTCPEEAFLTFENVHKWRMQEGPSGSSGGQRATQASWYQDRVLKSCQQEEEASQRVSASSKSKWVSSAKRSAAVDPAGWTGVWKRTQGRREQSFTYPDPTPALWGVRRNKKKAE